MGVVSSAHSSCPKGTKLRKALPVRREENAMNLMKQPFLAVRVGLHRKLDRLLTTVLLVSLSLAAGCTHREPPPEPISTVYVSKEMTWECAPEHYMSQYPEAQPVRFRFVEDPSYEEVASGRGLCDQLRASGKRVVVVEYETWGNSFRGLIGYREASVDGKPIVDVGGWGSSGAHGRVGPHPLEKLYKSSNR
jgi:hypothetical protein